MNLLDATDLMMQHGTAALPESFPIAYPDVPQSSDLTANNAWARITAKVANGNQRGFGDNIKKYITYGVLCIEVFTKPGDGLTKAQTLSWNAKVYLENIRSSPIWYRNIRAVDVGTDGGFTKYNVYADFEFEDNH